MDAAEPREMIAPPHAIRYFAKAFDIPPAKVPEVFAYVADEVNGYSGPVFADDVMLLLIISIVSARVENGR